MLNKIAENLNIILDNKLENEAVLNILQAKLCHIFSFKNIKFKSIENIKNTSPLSYYAFNFVPSGGSKDRLLREININLFSFFNDELEAYHRERQEILKNEQDEYVTRNTDKYKESDFKKLTIQNEKDVENLRKFPAEISASTQANIYDVLKIIEKQKYGSVLIKNTEFANFYEDTINSREKSKKEFLDMLFHLYDGDYEASGSMSTNRENIKDIPVSCIFMSDYELILQDSNLNKSFKSWLKRGMARRSFIYYKKGGHKPKFKLMDYEEKEQAYKYLNEASIRIKDIYNKIQKDNIYTFSMEANKAIFNYKLNVLERIEKMFVLNDVLDNDTSIIRLDLENSPWKIIKLAALYHVLENPQSSLIELSSFNKAVDFFNMTHGYLSELLEANSLTDHEELMGYLIKNINKWQNKTMIKSKNFVQSRHFSTWINEAIPVIAEMVDKKNLGFAHRITGKNNSGLEVCLYDPQTHEFRVTEHDPNKKIIKGELIDLSKTGRIEVTEI